MKMKWIDFDELEKEEIDSDETGQEENDQDLSFIKQLAEDRQGDSEEDEAYWQLPWEDGVEEKDITNDEDYFSVPMKEHFHREIESEEEEPEEDFFTIVKEEQNYYEMSDEEASQIPLEEKRAQFEKMLGFPTEEQSEEEKPIREEKPEEFELIEEVETNSELIEVVSIDEDEEEHRVMEDGEQEFESVEDAQEQDLKEDGKEEQEEIIYYDPLEFEETEKIDEHSENQFVEFKEKYLQEHVLNREEESSELELSDSIDEENALEEYEEELEREEELSTEESEEESEESEVETVYYDPLEFEEESERRLTDDEQFAAFKEQYFVEHVLNKEAEEEARARAEAEAKELEELKAAEEMEQGPWLRGKFFRKLEEEYEDKDEDLPWFVKEYNRKKAGIESPQEDFSEWKEGEIGAVIEESKEPIEELHSNIEPDKESMEEEAVEEALEVLYSKEESAIKGAVLIEEEGPLSEEETEKEENVEEDSSFIEEDRFQRIELEEQQKKLAREEEFIQQENTNEVEKETKADFDYLDIEIDADDFEEDELEEHSNIEKVEPKLEVNEDHTNEEITLENNHLDAKIKSEEKIATQEQELESPILHQAIQHEPRLEKNEPMQELESKLDTESQGNLLEEKILKLERQGLPKKQEKELETTNSKESLNELQESKQPEDSKKETTEEEYKDEQPEDSKEEIEEKKQVVKRTALGINRGLTEETDDDQLEFSKETGLAGVLQKREIPNRKKRNPKQIQEIYASHGQEDPLNLDRVNIQDVELDIELESDSMALQSQGKQISKLQSAFEEEFQIHRFEDDLFVRRNRKSRKTKEKLPTKTRKNHRKERGMKHFVKEALRLIIPIVIVVLITFLLVEYVGQRTEVNGKSMESTLQDGDNLIVDKITYVFKEPERFDIIVFPYKKEEDKEEVYYIKRIIGLPGEKVQISNGFIYINGKLLDESYGKDNELILNPGLAEMEIQLANDEYFVLGDNRNASSDSREIGNIKREIIVGRAWFRILPFSDFGLLKHQ